MEVWTPRGERFVIRKAYKHEYNLIGDTQLRGKMFQRFPKDSHILEYCGETFLITKKLADLPVTVQYIEPYTGRFPKMALMWRNFKERYLCK